MRVFQRGTGRAGFPAVDAAPALAAALVPVVARALEVGGGPPGLEKWVRAAAGPRAQARSANDGLVRDLARRLAERLNRGGINGTVADQHRQTVRAERPGLKGGHGGEAGVG